MRLSTPLQRHPRLAYQSVCNLVHQAFLVCLQRKRQAKSMALVEQYTGKENLLWKKLAHIHHGKYPRVPLSLRPRAPAFKV